MPRPVVPSLQRLAPAALANDGEYRALAALVAAGAPNQVETVRLLAGAAGKGDVLQWLLVLDLTEALWAEVAAMLPDKIAVNGRTEAHLGKLVAACLAAPASHQASAVAKIVRATADGTVRLALARKIAKGAPASGPLHDAAFGVIAESAQPQDRPTLLKDATRPDAALPDRIKRLDALGELTKPAEKRAAQAVLTELASYPSEVDNAAVGRICTRLDRAWVATWFYSPWPHTLVRVSTKDFGAELGRERLAGLVRPAMTVDQIQAVYAAAYGLERDDDAALGALLVKKGHALPDGAARYLKATEGPGVRDEGWQVLLADRAGALTAVFSDAATPDTVAKAAGALRDHPQVVARLVELTSSMSARMSEHDPATGVRTPDADWTGMVVSVAGTLGAPFLRALAPQFQNLTIPAEVLDLVVADDDTAVAFVKAGAADEVAGHATAPETAARLIRACGTLLARDHVDDLLTVVGTTDADVWSGALSDAAAAGHADVVCDWAAGVVARLRDPVQASRPDPGIAATTIRIALGNGPADTVELDVLDRVGFLLDADRHPELVDTGCEWATALSPGKADLESLVKAAVDADSRRANPHPALTALRAHFAQVLVDTARDVHEKAPDRADALRLAVQADADLAYPAAVDLAGNDDRAVNLAAAHVLSTSAVKAEDIPRLQAVLAAETDAAARDLYGQALTRVHAKAAQDAIHRLLDLTGESASTTLVVAVAPHDGTPEADRLVHAANEVLQSDSPATPPTAS